MAKAPGPGPGKEPKEAPGAGPAVLLDDAGKIRAAADRTARRTGREGRSGKPPGPTPPPEPATGVDPQAAQFWGRQYAAFWNQIAAGRGWPLMPGAPVDPNTGIVKPAADPATFAHNIGQPVARTMDRLLPAIDERPWMQVALLSLPFALGAATVEGQRLGRYLRDRRDVAAGRPSRRTGADRPGQDRVRPGMGEDAGLTPGLQPSGDR